MPLDLLIDADIYLYQAAAACEVETDWGDDNWTLHSDAGQVRKAFANVVQRFQDELGGGEPILCFSDPSRRSFRHDLTETYKQARKGTRKPLAYAACRDRFAAEYKTVIKPRLEADDVMGIVSTRAPGKFIIVTADKDLLSIPGKVYRTALSGADGKMHDITPHQADKYHMMQTLTGDVTDGYPGCPGMGPVGAEKLVGQADYSPVSVWQRVVKAFTKAKLTEADALLQARLARILRNTEWDFDKSEVKLWSPPR